MSSEVSYPDPREDKEFILKIIKSLRGEPVIDPAQIKKSKKDKEAYDTYKDYQIAGSCAP